MFDVSVAFEKRWDKRHPDVLLLCNPLFNNGIPVCWINQDQPKSKRPQPPISDTKFHEQVQSKLVNFKEKGYIY